MADTITTNLGGVSAYLDAKKHGFTGTREEFGELLANSSKYAAEGKETLRQIDTKTTEALQNIRDKEEESIEAVNQRGNIVLDALGRKQTSAEAAIVAKGQETMESIPDDYSALNGEVNQLKADLTDLNDGVLTIAFLMNFENGGMSGVTPYPPQKNRIHTISPITLERNTTFTVKEGFILLYRGYTNGVYDSSKNKDYGEKVSFTVPKNEPFQCVIRRVTENSNEIANISEFTSAIKYNAEWVNGDENVKNESISSTVDIIADTNKNLLFLGEFEVGGVTSAGDNYAPQKWRVRSKGITKIAINVSLIIPNDLFLIAYPFTAGKRDGTKPDINVTNKTIDLVANSEYRFVIRRTTENTSETNNVAEFTSKIAVQIGTDKVLSQIKKKAFVKNPNVKFMCHQGFSDTEQYGRSKADGYIRAAELGFDFGECDVRFSADNIPVCCHDETFDSNGETVVIANTNYNVLKTKNYYGGVIASFDEVVKNCKIHGIGLCIDQLSSSFSEAQWSALFEIVSEYQMQRNVIWNTGTNSAMVDKVLAYDKYATLGINVSAKAEIINAINIAKSFQTDFNHLYVAINYTTITPEELRDFSKLSNGRVQLSVWTIDDKNIINNYLPYAAIITSNKISFNML